MLVVGAGGLALQMIDDLEERFGKQTLAFWSEHAGNKLIADQYRILSADDEVHTWFAEQGPEAVLAVGGCSNRERLFERFTKLGAQFVSCISPKAHISKYAQIDAGCVVLAGAVIEAGVSLRPACLVNTGALVTHECSFGEFCELAPGVALGGKVQFGKRVFAGLNATVLPGISIGDDCVIAAGAVVTRSWSNNNILIGIPAKNARKN